MSALSPGIAHRGFEGRQPREGAGGDAHQRDRQHGLRAQHAGHGGQRQCHRLELQLRLAGKAAPQQPGNARRDRTARGIGRESGGHPAGLPCQEMTERRGQPHAQHLRSRQQGQRLQARLRFQAMDQQDGRQHVEHGPPQAQQQTTRVSHRQACGVQQRETGHRHGYRACRAGNQGQDAHALGPASGEDRADQRRHDADADDGAGAGCLMAGRDQRIRQQETRAVGQRQRHGGQQVRQQDAQRQPVRQLRCRILGCYEMTGRETGRCVHGWRRSGRIVGAPPLSPTAATPASREPTAGRECPRVSA